MAWLKRLLLMLQFMTAIPIRTNMEAEREDFGRGLSAAPLVGLVIGVLLASGNYLFGLLLPAQVDAVLTFGLYIILTGGLHLDGLGDTADGLFSSRPKERMLEIMKDSRVGTNAVLILIIVLLLDISLLASMREFTTILLVFMPVAGRIGSLAAAGTSRYAGVSDGPGRWCVEHCGAKNVAAGLVIYFILFSSAALIIFCGRLFVGVSGQIALLMITISFIPPVSAFLLARILGKKLGGVTGDILGAVCELNQVIFLLVAYILLKFAFNY